MQKLIILVILILAGTMLLGCTEPTPTPTPADTTFTKITVTDGPVDMCAIDGKPIVRLYSTTWCPHCVWIKPTFDRVVQEYVAQGKIIAYHWEMDTGDNTLTAQVETSVPENEQAIFSAMSPNGNVPAFLFGCSYYRLGNGYEQTKDLNAEENEFRAIIEDLIK